MKYCSHCGNQIEDQAVICVKCGCAVASHSNVADIPSTGLNALSFFIPIVGLILYIVYHDKAPNKAKEIGKWALIGFGIGLIFSCIVWPILVDEFFWYYY